MFRVTRYASSYSGLPDTNSLPDAAPVAKNTGVPVEQSAVGECPPLDGPPQVAIGACSGLSEGDDCQFAAPRGFIAGACEPVQTQLVCVPQVGAVRGAPYTLVRRFESGPRY